MSSLTNWLKAGIYLGRLSLTSIFLLVDYQYTIWRAKGHFKHELVNAGLPYEAADTLTRSYNDSNKRMLSLVNTGLFRMGRGRRRVRTSRTSSLRVHPPE